MFIYNTKRGMGGKVVAILLASSLVFSGSDKVLADVADALSVPSPFRPVEGVSDFSSDLFRHSAAFRYISGLIGKYMNMDISSGSINNHVARIKDGMIKHISPANMELIKAKDPFLAGADIENSGYVQEGRVYNVPVYRNDVHAFNYRYYTDPRIDTSPDWEVSLSDGSKVYVKVEIVAAREISLRERVENFIDENAFELGRALDGAVHMMTPDFVLEDIFSTLEEELGDLSGKHLLDLGAGDLRVSLWASNLADMRVTACEKDGEVSEAALRVFEKAEDADLVDGAKVEFLPYTDAFNTSWSEVDVVYVFYPFPAGSKNDQDFRRLLQKKARELPPDARIAVLFTSEQTRQKYGASHVFSDLTPLWQEPRNISQARGGLYLSMYEISEGGGPAEKTGLSEVKGEAPDPRQIRPAYLGTLHSTDLVPTVEDMLFKMQVEADCAIRIMLNHPPLSELGISQQLSRLNISLYRSLSEGADDSVRLELLNAIQDEYDSLVGVVHGMIKYLARRRKRIGELFDYKYETRRYLEKVRLRFWTRRDSMLSDLGPRMEREFGEEKAKQAVAIVEESFKRIDELLVFSSRFLRGISETVTGDINKVIHETVDKVGKEHIGPRDIRVEVSPADEKLQKVSFDEMYVRHLVSELVRNALKERGVTEIRVEYGYVESEGKFRLRVSDNGKGIDLRLLAKEKSSRQELFKYNITSAGRTEQRSEGTGLGLAFLYEIMDRMKGSIEASNKQLPLTGAVFEAEFPLRERRFIPVIRHGAVDIFPESNVSILALDDSTQIGFTVFADADHAAEEVSWNPQQIKGRVHFHDTKYGTDDSGEPIWMVVDMKRVEEIRPGKYRFGVRLPEGFEGEFTFMYSVDGGFTWIPTTRWKNNYRIVRDRSLDESKDSDEASLLRVTPEVLVRYAREAAMIYDPRKRGQCADATDFIRNRLAAKTGIKARERMIKIPHDLSREVMRGRTPASAHVVLEVYINGMWWVVDTQLPQFIRKDTSKPFLSQDFLFRGVYPARDYYAAVPAYPDDMCRGDRIKGPAALGDTENPIPGPADTGIWEGLMYIYGYLSALSGEWWDEISRLGIVAPGFAPGTAAAHRLLAPDTGADGHGSPGRKLRLSVLRGERSDVADILMRAERSYNAGRLDVCLRDIMRILGIVVVNVRWEPNMTAIRELIEAYLESVGRENKVTSELRSISDILRDASARQGPLRRLLRRNLRKMLKAIEEIEEAVQERRQAALEVRYDRDDISERDMEVLEALIKDHRVINDAFANIFMRDDLSRDDVKGVHIRCIGEGGFKKVYSVAMELYDRNYPFNFLLKLVKEDVKKSDSGYDYTMEYAETLMDIDIKARETDYSLHLPAGGLYGHTHNDGKQRIIFSEGYVHSAIEMPDEITRERMSVGAYIRYWKTFDKQLYFHDPKMDNVVIRKTSRGYAVSIIDIDNVEYGHEISPGLLVDAFLAFNFSPEAIVRGILDTLGPEEAENFIVTALGLIKVYMKKEAEEILEWYELLKDEPLELLPEAFVPTPSNNVEVSVNGKDVKVPETSSVLDIMNNYYSNVRTTEVIINGSRINIGELSDKERVLEFTRIKEGDVLVFLDADLERGGGDQVLRARGAALTGLFVLGIYSGFPAAGFAAGLFVEFMAGFILPRFTSVTREVSALDTDEQSLRGRDIIVPAPEGLPELRERIVRELQRREEEGYDRPVLVFICGQPGTGKSSISANLTGELFGIEERQVTRFEDDFSDDSYYRMALDRNVFPETKLVIIEGYHTVPDLAGKFGPDIIAEMFTEDEKRRTRVKERAKKMLGKLSYDPRTAEMERIEYDGIDLVIDTTGLAPDMIFRTLSGERAGEVKEPSKTYLEGISEKIPQPGSGRMGEDMTRFMTAVLDLMVRRFTLAPVRKECDSHASEHCYASKDVTARVLAFDNDMLKVNEVLAELPENDKESVVDLAVDMVSSRIEELALPSSRAPLGTFSYLRERIGFALFTARKPGFKGISYNEYRETLRAVELYDLMLRVLFLRGVFGDAAVYPASGVDFFPAKYVPLFQIEGYRHGMTGGSDNERFHAELQREFINTLSGKVGVEARAVRNNLETSLQDVTPYGTFEMPFRQEDGRFPRRSFILKGSSYVTGYDDKSGLFAHSSSLDYISGLDDRLLRKGDTVILLGEDTGLAEYFRMLGNYEEVSVGERFRDALRWHRDTVLSVEGSLPGYVLFNAPASVTVLRKTSVSAVSVKDQVFRRSSEERRSEESEFEKYFAGLSRSRRAMIKEVAESVARKQEWKGSQGTGSRRLFVGVEGFDASGKSYFVERELAPYLKYRLGRKVEILHGDWCMVEKEEREKGLEGEYSDYYRWFDHERLSLWLNELHRPGDLTYTIDSPYVSETGEREGKEDIYVDDGTVVIVEGLFLQRDDAEVKLRPMMDQFVYFDVTEQTSLARQMERDPEKMGRTEDQVRRYVEDIFIKKHREYAGSVPGPLEMSDVVVDNDEFDSPAVRDRKPGQMTAGVTPAEEKKKAITFSDTLKIARDKARSSGAVRIALGTDWIKGYSSGRDQHLALNPLMSDIRSFCESLGISFVAAPDADLIAAIERDNDNRMRAARRSGAEYKKPETIVIADRSSVTSRDFLDYRKNEKAFLVGVEGRELTEHSYIRLLDILTLAFNLRYNTIFTANPDNYPNIGLFNENGIPILLPAATPFFTYEELVAFYAVQRSV